MAIVNLTNIANGQLADATVVMANYNAIIAQVNGNLDNQNVSPALLAQIGASDLVNIRSGAVIIPTTEVRTNPAYGLMPTADRVANVVLPSTGIIKVLYEATWQESVANAARAAIFLTGGQLKVASGLAQPGAQAATTGGTSATDMPLSSFPLGLVGGVSSGGYAGDVTTGQVFGSQAGNYLIAAAPFAVTGVGGPCYIFAAAGTYDVSVQFLASSGNVTVKNRRLYVKSIAF